MVKIGKHQTLAGHMAPRTLQGEALQRVIVQAIKRVVPDDFTAVMRIALLNHGSDGVPSEVADLTHFVLDPLRKAADDLVGADKSSKLVKSLMPLLRSQARADEDLDGGDRDDAEPGNPVSPSVLVVDSDHMHRALLLKQLKQKGFSAVSALDTNVALALCMRHRPRVVVAVDEGDIDGRNLAALLKVAFGAEAPQVILVLRGSAAPRSEWDGPVFDSEAGDALIGELRDMFGDSAPPSND